MIHASSNDTRYYFYKNIHYFMSVTLLAQLVTVMFLKKVIYHLEHRMTYAVLDFEQ